MSNQIEEVKGSLRIIQASGYRWIERLGDLIAQGKLEEAGDTKNEGFALFDEIGRIQNEMSFPCVTEINSGPAKTITNLAINSVTTNQAFINFDISPVVDVQVAIDSGSGFFSLSNTGVFPSHNYAIHNQTTLSPDTAYTIRLTAVDGSPVCTTGFRTEAVIASPGNEPPVTARDLQLQADGWEYCWGSTPALIEVGQENRTYLFGPHWSNGHPIAQYSDRAIRPDLIELDPLEGTPCVTSYIAPFSETGDDTSQGASANGILIRGQQLSVNGKECSEVIWSGEFFSPLPEDGGMIHPTPANPGVGAYIGFGPHTVSDPGETGSPGGSNWLNGAANSFRVPLGNSSQLYIYGYTNEQYIAGGGTGSGRAYIPLGSDNVFYADIQNRWNTIELRLKLDSPASANNGEMELIVNGVSLRTWTGRDLIARDGMLPKGYGIFTQQIYVVAALGSKTYHRRFKIFLR